MAQREFFCPKCNSSLQKSDAMMMLSEIHESGSSYMGNVSVDHINCPACGAAISVREAVAGNFDGPRSGPIGNLIGLAILGGIIFFVVKACSG
jgi:hypothetical protein